MTILNLLEKLVKGILILVACLLALAIIALFCFLTVVYHWAMVMPLIVFIVFLMAFIKAIWDKYYE